MQVEGDSLIITKTVPMFTAGAKTRPGSIESGNIIFMNARTKTQTKQEQEKPKSAKTTVEESKPLKLRGNTKTHVAASKPSPYARKPRDSVNLKDTKKTLPQNRQIGLKTPLKRAGTSPNQRARMATSAPNQRPQKFVKLGAPSMSSRSASTARVGPGGPSGIQDRLKRKSPWFSSIMEPIKGGGVKIPDPVGTDTGTYQHVENVSVPVNANGVSGLRIISPYINNYIYGSSVNGEGSNYQTTMADSAPGNLFWTGPIVAGPGVGAFPFARVPAMMKATAQSHRVVSCSVLAQPEVSTLSDAGEMCAFVKPYDCNDSDVAYSTYQGQWDTSLMPINVHKPLIARIYPVKSDYELFNTVTSAGANQHEPQVVGYDDFIDPDIQEDEDGVIPWEIGIVCSGMAPSVGTVRYQIVVNYEFIPKTQNTMVDCQPSPIDPTEEQLVCSWVSDCPVTGVVPQKLASAAQEASTVTERSEPSGFGMLFNVVEEMMPLIKTGMALL